MYNSGCSFCHEAVVDHEVEVKSIITFYHEFGELGGDECTFGVFDFLGFSVRGRSLINLERGRRFI